MRRGQEWKLIGVAAWRKEVRWNADADADLEDGLAAVWAGWDGRWTTQS